MSLPAFPSAPPSAPAPARVRPIATACVLVATAALTAANLAGAPVVATLGRSLGALERHEWWRLLTPIFVERGGWPEIGINLVSLALVGAIVERTFGWRTWLVTYVIAGVVGEIAGFAWKPVGAGSSVAVAGLVGAVAAWRVLRRPTGLGLAIGVVVVVGAFALVARHDLHGPPILAGLLAGAAALAPRAERARSIDG